MKKGVLLFAISLFAFIFASQSAMAAEAKSLPELAEAQAANTESIASAKGDVYVRVRVITVREEKIVVDEKGNVSRSTVEHEEVEVTIIVTA